MNSIKVIMNRFSCNYQALAQVQGMFFKNIVITGIQSLPDRRAAPERLATFFNRNCNLETPIFQEIS